MFTPKDQEKMTFTCPYSTFAYRRMLFGLCNTPATFQYYMMSIFSNMVKKFMEVFLGEFTGTGCSFENYLVNLSFVLKRYVKTNLVLNWKKCHFMVHDRIIIEHLISKNVIELDKAKVEVIEKLPPPTSVSGV